MRALQINSGDRYERWTIIKEVEKNERGKRRVFCKCDCGTESIVDFSGLRMGHTKSCGCLKKELAVQRGTKHGNSKRTGASKEYKCWQYMKDRCCNPNNKRYEDYGDRGITVCDRWLESFENFLEDMGPKPEPKKDYSIERKDNNLGYSKENCKWATALEQNNNSRNNHIIRFNGEELTLTEWSNKLGIKVTTLLNRINEYGWTVERAFTTPVTHRKE